MIDLAAVERLRSIGGADLVGKMIDLFLENTPKRIAAALEGEKTGNWYEVERAAHSLKSSAANLGLTGLQGLAREAEELAGRREAGKIGPLLRGMESQFPALRALLEEQRKASHA